MRKDKIQLQFTSQVWQEGKTYIGFAPQLQVASCGKTKEDAQRNLIEAVGGFVETAREMGTLTEILEEAGFTFEKREEKKWVAPELVSLEKMSLVA